MSRRALPCPAPTLALALAAGLAALATTTACTNQDDDGDVGDGPSYEFASDEPSAYARVDRIGMPAVGTAVITDKQAYNEADPAADAAGDFVAQITANLDALHVALDDDLMGAGLTPCATDACVQQAAPLVVPDTLKIDLGAASGFPNGRALTDPVVDVTLAVVLLDLSVDGQEVSSLVGVLNPSANDLEFGADFPYLAPPHEP